MVKLCAFLTTFCAVAGQALSEHRMDGTDAADHQVRISWIGASSTFFHEMPKQMSDWLSVAGVCRGVETTVVGRGGTGIHVYLRRGFVARYGLEKNETVLGHIKRQKPNVVVLQISCHRLVGEDKEEMQRAIDLYVACVRDAGGEPVLYEKGWTRDREESNRGQIACFQAAVRNRCAVAPCRTAWRRVWREQPELDLHYSDGKHPGALGAYLNMCCLFAAMTGKSPVGVPSDIRAWGELSVHDNEDNAAAEREAAKARGEEIFSWQVKNQVINVPVQPVKLSKEDARYFQEVAWQCWCETLKRLAEAGAHIRIPLEGRDIQKAH